jgi:hypothetical protein
MSSSKTIEQPLQEAYPEGRKRATKACIECKSKHTKCGFSRPCLRCQSLGLECLDVVPKKRYPSNHFKIVRGSKLRTGTNSFPIFSQINFSLMKKEIQSPEVFWSPNSQQNVNPQYMRHRSISLDHSNVDASSIPQFHRNSSLNQFQFENQFIQPETKEEEELDEFDHEFDMNFSSSLFEILDETEMMNLN